MLKLSSITSKYIALDEKDDSLVSQVMFFIPFTVWLATRILFSYSSFMSFMPQGLTMNMIRDACITVLIIREILFGKWDRLAFLGLMTLGVMSAACYFGNWLIIIDGAFMIFAARNLDFKRVAIASFAVMVCTVPVVMICSQVGILPDYILAGSERGERHYLGFGHPNTGAAFALFLLFLYIYLRGKKICVVDALVAAVLSFVVYHFAISRTVFYLAIFAIVCALVIKHVPERFLKSKVVKFLSIGSFIICAIVSIALIVAYDPANPALVKLDGFLSGRLSLGHTALLDNGVPIFGQMTDITGVSNYNLATGSWTKRSGGVVDNAYIKMIVMMGVIFFILAMLLCTLAAKRAYDNEQWYLLLVIVCTAIYGISEAVWLYAYFNPFLLFGGQLFATKHLTAKEPVDESGVED